MIKNKPFIIISFNNDCPVYNIFNNGKLKRINSVDLSKRLFLLVLIPEDYIFYHIPKNIPCLSKKKSIPATKIYLDNLFPSKDYEVLYHQHKLLACYKSPSLDEFISKHKKIFKAANVITSIYILSYYYGNQSLQKKIKEVDVCKILNIENVAQNLDLPKLSKIKEVNLTPGNIFQEQKIDKRYYRLAYYLLMVLFFILIGHGAQYKKIDMNYQTWNNSVEELYDMALGENHNSNDPYGMILYKENKIKNINNKSIEILKLLKALSKSKHREFSVDKIEVKAKSIIISGHFNNYKSIENLVSSLNKKNGYSFNIDDTQEVGSKVRFSMRTKMST